jgi:methionine sulfoxide reductase heme-binding subunit
MTDVRFNKILLSLNALLPLGLLIFDAYYGRLGANPIEFFLRATGILTLVFLVITLAVSPLRRLLGWNSLVSSIGARSVCTRFLWVRALNDVQHF